MSRVSYMIAKSKPGCDIDSEVISSLAQIEEYSVGKNIQCGLIITDISDLGLAHELNNGGCYHARTAQSSACLAPSRCEPPCTHKNRENQLGTRMGEIECALNRLII